MLAWLRGQGAGRPRSAGEIYSWGCLQMHVRRTRIDAVLERMVARGELVAVDGVPARNLRGDRRPYRGYAAAGERGGAA